MAFFNSQALALAPFSPSKLGTLGRCGLQMHYKYVQKIKEYSIPKDLKVEVDDSAAKLGTALHRTSELMHEGKSLKDSVKQSIKEGKVSDDVALEVEMYKNTVASFQSRLAAFKKGFKISIEHREIELAVDGDLSPCSYWDSSAVMRGKADCILISADGKTAIVIDLKSSKRATLAYAQDQLDFYSLMVFSNFPKVETIKNGLFFLKHGRMMWSNQLLKRGAWDGSELISKINSLSEEFIGNMMPEISTSPLCNYCIYKGLCEKERSDRKTGP